jgi:hypothetical protein
MRRVVQIVFQSGACFMILHAYEDYVQEAYHPNGLPEYDKTVDFQRRISFFILTIISKLFRFLYLSQTGNG